MTSIILNGLTESQFKELIAQTFEEQLGRKLAEGSKFYYNGILIGTDKEKEVKKKEEYLTRGQVAKQLQISLPTLHNYTKDGYIKSYRIGGKVRYKADDIELALTERNFTVINRKGGRNAAA